MKSDNGRVLIGQADSFVHLLALPPAPSALKRPQTASPMPVNYRIRYRFFILLGAHRPYHQQLQL